MPAYVWFSIVAGLAIGFSFMNIPPVADQFMAIFGIGYGGLSLFLSGLLWSHALTQIPGGLLSDKVHPAKILKTAFAAGILLNLLPFAMPDSLAAATCFRLLLGVCTGVSFLGTLQVLALITPPDEMPKAQGYYGGAFGFGTMLPYFVLPILDGQVGHGWAFAYLVTAALYLAAMTAVFLLPPEAGRPKAPAAENAPGIGLILRRVISAPDIWMLGIIHGVFYGSLNNLGQWLPSILSDISQKPLAAWTLATTLVLFLGSACRWFSGHAAKAVPPGRLIPMMLVIVFVLYLCLGAAWNGPVGFGVGLLLAASCGVCHGTLFAMVVRVLPAAFMGTSLGLMNTVANLTNVGLTLGFGYTRETAGSFSPALYLSGGLALLLAIVFRGRLRRFVSAHSQNQ